VTEKLDKKSEDLCADHNRPHFGQKAASSGRSSRDRVRTFDDGPAPRGWQEELPKDGKKVNLYDYLWPWPVCGLRCFTKDVNKPGTSTAIYPRRRENPYIVDAGVGTPTPAL